MAEITRAGAVEVMREAYRNSKFDTAWMDDAEGTRENMATAAALDALLAYLEANGWTPPMPKEATAEMVLAATRRQQGPTEGLYTTVYRAMCAAAPNPLAQETTDGE